MSPSGVLLALAATLAFVANQPLALPLAVCALVRVLRAPSAKHLRAIGCGLVGASLIAMLLHAITPL